MISAFYTAASGVSAMQRGMDVVANNIANVNTQGFKGSKASFSDLLYTNIHEQEGDSNLKTGHGTAVRKTDILHNQSGLIGTERVLDFALNSDGFFAIETLDGTKYTRQGDFNMVKLGNKFYLADSRGGYVLDTKGKRIEVKDPEDELDVGIFTFPNNDGLDIQGGMYFVETERSGKPTLDKDPEFKRGYLENSNVDMAQSMSDVIVLQRSFQFNTRMVQMSDEIMQTVNALR